MDRDHYLPAAYMGRFSGATSGPRRKRPIHVIDRDNEARARGTISEHIAWSPDMYTLKLNAESPRQIDDSWTAYEERLMQALDALADKPADLDAKQWLRVLLPFVAGLFVRGPDFGPRHDARLPPLDALDQDDNNNHVRLVEQARILAPLMSAIWAVATFPGPTDLITSDRGYGFAWHKDYGRGFAVPIDTRQALLLLPGQQRVVLRADKDKWRAPIETWMPSDQLAQHINASVASHALTTLIGPTAASVENFAVQFAGEADLETEPFNADWPSSRVRRMHEWDWHRAVHVIAERPSDNEPVPDQLHEIDLDRFGKEWIPRLLLAVGNPDGMSRGLSRHGDEVGLCLTAEEDLPPWPPPSLPGPSAPNPGWRSKARRARAVAEVSRRKNRRR